MPLDIIIIFNMGVFNDLNTNTDEWAKPAHMPADVKKKKDKKGRGWMGGGGRSHAKIRISSTSFVFGPASSVTCFRKHGSE